MLATARSPRCPASSRRRNDKFLQLLRTIREQAEYAFRGIPVDAREELMQEVVAQAYALFVRLRQGASRLSSMPHHSPSSRLRRSVQAGDLARRATAGTSRHRVRL